MTRQALVDLGFVEGRGPGPRADELIPGGFAGFRLDEPGELRLYSNAQGGFRVRCPDTAVSIVTQFRVALSGWRQGGSDRIDCEACGRSHALYELDYAPRAAFGRGAVVLIDVASATPRLGGLTTVRAQGGLRARQGHGGGGGAKRG